MKCDEHGRLVEMLESNTRMTTHILQAVRRTDKRMQAVEQSVARQEGITTAVKAGIGVVIGGAGVAVAIAALLANILT